MIRSFASDHPPLPVSLACACLGISRAQHYRYLRASAKDPDPDRELRSKIEETALEFSGYGYRRVTHHLKRQGVKANGKRVLRVMRESGLLHKTKKRWIRTTDSLHGLKVYPNLLKGVSPKALNEAFVADITYVRLPRGFCFVAAILDAFSRKVVGYNVSLELDASLALRALEMMLANRRPEPGFIHHSDRGVQYACRRYARRLLDAGGKISMAPKGAPLENALAESFFKTLKTEEVYLQEYQSLAEAEASIGHFIEAVYNRRRLHSALGYRPPEEFETELSARAGH